MSSRKLEGPKPCENGNADNSSLPLRSILKKVPSDGAVLKSTSPSMGATTTKCRSISFDEKVIHWEDDPSGLESTESRGEVGMSLVDGGSSSSSHPSRDQDATAVEGYVAATHTKNPMRGLLTSGAKVKSKMGSLLKRSSRTQVQGSSSELECSDSVANFSRDDRSSRELKQNASAASFSASSEYCQPKNTNLGREYCRPKSTSLTRNASLDSSDLFTPNKSLRSKIARFGRRFKHDCPTEGGTPILTKVTFLGALMLLLLLL